MPLKTTHDNHDIMTKINKFSYDLDPGRLEYLPKPEDHETCKLKSSQNPRASWRARQKDCKYKPSQETLVPARGLQRFVNEDVVWVAAKRVLGLFPQVAYKLSRHAGVDDARMKACFVISLFATGWFQTTQDGQYEPSISGSQQRARNCLMGMVYGNKPVMLQYVGPEFFKVYPELRAQALQAKAE